MYGNSTRDVSFYIVDGATESNCEMVVIGNYKKSEETKAFQDLLYLAVQNLNLRKVKLRFLS